jgi:hypothetical protein
MSGCPCADGADTIGEGIEAEVRDTKQALGGGHEMGDEDVELVPRSQLDGSIESDGVDEGDEVSQSLVGQSRIVKILVRGSCLFDREFYLR